MEEADCQHSQLARLVEKARGKVRRLPAGGQAGRDLSF
jgi:hypothetical protein